MGLADQLTIARAGAVPIVAALYISSFHWHDYWATGLFCLAMSTDWFDGRIARSRGRTSELGSLLDPVADKLLVLTVLIVLIGRGVFPAWMVGRRSSPASSSSLASASPRLERLDRVVDPARRARADLDLRARLRPRGTRPAPRARSCLVVWSGH